MLPFGKLPTLENYSSTLYIHFFCLFFVMVGNVLRTICPCWIDACFMLDFIFRQVMASMPRLRWHLISFAWNKIDTKSIKSVVEFCKCFSFLCNSCKTYFISLSFLNLLFCFLELVSASYWNLFVVDLSFTTLAVVGCFASCSIHLVVHLKEECFFDAVSFLTIVGL